MVLDGGGLANADRGGVGARLPSVGGHVEAAACRVVGKKPDIDIELETPLLFVLFSLKS